MFSLSNLRAYLGPNNYDFIREFHCVIIFFENYSTCMPITANIKIIMTRTNVKFPKAPIVLPMIDIKRLNVGHDLPNLNIRNLNDKN